MKTALFVLIGIGIGLGAYFLVSAMHQPLSLNPVLLPFYPGATWGPIKTAQSNGAEGAEVESEPITNLDNIAASSTPFMEYYRSKLAQGGWLQDQSREAGGPGAEVSVYTRGSEFVILSFHTVFHTKPQNAPETCPCDLQFELFSGTTK